MKPTLRDYYRSVREKVSTERLIEAQEALLDHLLPLIDEVRGPVLSFSSFRTEIDMSRVNTLLAKKERLVLPRVEGDELHFYLVSDVALLKKSDWGIHEPHPEVHELASLDDLHLAFVPGLAFDGRGHRLGYGGGFYDRELHALSHALVCGVGFKEQLSPVPLPSEPHDVPIDRLVLV